MQQRDDREDAGQAVVEDHEEADDAEADDAGDEAPVDRVLTERRADGAALHDFQRHRERAGLELDDEVVDLGRRHAVDDALVGDGAVDRRRRDDRLVEDDRHRLADVVAGEREEVVGGVAFELEADDDLTELRWWSR